MKQTADFNPGNPDKAAIAFKLKHGTKENTIQTTGQT